MPGAGVGPSLRVHDCPGVAGPGSFRTLNRTARLEEYDPFWAGPSDFLAQRHSGAYNPQERSTVSRTTESVLRLGRAVAAAHDVVTRVSPALRAPDALRYLLARVWTRLDGSGRLVVLHPRRIQFPLLCRLGTSDLDNFDQIFVEREYAPLDDLADVALVVDCGAYVGYSASYLLSQFPRCQLIAVEANSANCRLLRRNLAAYGKRVDVIEAAVWSQSASLAAAADQYRDGREWNFHVREAETDDEATIPALGIADILRRSGMTSISLLKMDVEGAEIAVFSNGVEEWIDAVETLVIELHDDSPYGAATPSTRSRWSVLPRTTA